LQNSNKSAIIKEKRKGKNMDVGSITQIVSTVGFPIAMCVALLWYIKDLTDKHKQETEQFTEALNNNTLILQKLCDTLGVEREV
jgi:hypothetical protein